MMKHRMRLEKGTFLIQVLGTEVILVKIVKKIEIALIFCTPSRSRYRMGLFG